MIYGSDLDLVYFARDREAASALARRLGALLASPTDYGRLYDIDTRLRPGGRGGPLVTTVAEFTNYFESGVGETWERMAYTRARPVAGPPSSCEEVTAGIAHAIYTPGFDTKDARAAIAMREKLARAGGDDSVKRGRSGGVVDIEFLIQMLALRHGVEHPELRTGGVLQFLSRVQDTGVMKRQEAADVEVAYRFLLALESKIRIVTDLREDRLPEQLKPLARRLGYADTELMLADDALREEYQYHREVAANAFRRATAALT
jgi:glutamate-ammonia-ligase adenylyltransferase